jgi:hypothetical protein
MRTHSTTDTIAAAKKMVDQIDSDLNTQSAALDCLGDMLAGMGDLADAAKTGDMQAQTYFALSHSVEAIHDNVGKIIEQLARLRHGVLGPPLPKWRGKAVRS